MSQASSDFPRGNQCGLSMLPTSRPANYSNSKRFLPRRRKMANIDEKYQAFPVASHRVASRLTVKSRPFHCGCGRSGHVFASRILDSHTKAERLRLIRGSPATTRRRQRVRVRNFNRSRREARCAVRFPYYRGIREHVCAAQRNAERCGVNRNRVCTLHTIE